MGFTHWCMPVVSLQFLSTIKNSPHFYDVHDVATSELAFSSIIDFTDMQTAVASKSENEREYKKESITTSDPEPIHDEPSDSKQANDKPQHPLLAESDDELDAIDSHTTFADNFQEYMHWHYRSNHASFNTKLNMKSLRQLSKEISSIIKKMDEH